MSACLHVLIIRAQRRAEGMTKEWQAFADEDAAQLIGLIGIDSYAAWVRNGSGITDRSTWRDVSLAISEMICQVLQERLLTGLGLEDKEPQP